MLIKSSFLQLLIILSVFISLNACDQPSGNNNQFTSKIDDIFAEYDDPNKPGAAVAVVKDGEVVFKKGYGSANLEYDIPVSPSTVFHIASVSKQFTAFSIFLLADEGKLSIDDDIRKYIPEVPDFGKTITLRHLATHTSGLRDQWNLLAMAGWRLDDVITREHVLKLVAKQEALNFDPGERFIYCNTGFTLLAEVVSRVSGKSFAEFTKENIFDPLKMEHTLFYDDHEKIVENRAYSYYSDDTGYKKSVLSYANVGATSLFTTVEDLSLWAMNFNDPVVGNAEIINQMNTLAVLNDGETFGGAYGQFVAPYKGLHQIQHGGADAGYRTYFSRFPDQKFAVAVFSNFAYANPNNLALQVADLYLADDITEASAKTPETSAASEAPEEKTFITLTTAQLEKFAGNYWNERDAYTRRMYVRNDTLIYFRNEGNESVLAPFNDSTFQMLNVEVDLTVKFDLNSDRPGMIVKVNDDEPSFFSSFVPAEFSTEDLATFTGSFYSPELSTTYTFEVKDDQLIASHSRHSDIEISAIKGDLFSGNRWFFSEIEFHRDDNNEIDGVYVSSGRVLGLWFDKVE